MLPQVVIEGLRVWGVLKPELLPEEIEAWGEIDYDDIRRLYERRATGSEMLAKVETEMPLTMHAEGSTLG